MLLDWTIFQEITGKAFSMRHFGSHYYSKSEVICILPRQAWQFFVLKGVGWGRVLNFSWTDGSNVFGDELSQTRIYYVICLTYKFCLRSKSEREKKTITIIFLVVVVIQTNDQGSCFRFQLRQQMTHSVPVLPPFDTNRKLWRLKWNKIKVVLGFLKMVKNTPFLYPIILFLDDIITSMVYITKSIATGH